MRLVSAGPLTGDDVELVLVSPMTGLMTVGLLTEDVIELEWGSLLMRLVSVGPSTGKLWELGSTGEQLIGC